MTARITAADAEKSADALRQPVRLNEYQQNVAKALTRAFDAQKEVEEADLDTARIVVFSDHHKGARDNADDFRGCERAYAAALAYYLEEEFRLIALGDAEELWECSPKEVVKAYPDVLGLESQFHASGRYERFWGNHDLVWNDKGQVSKHLQAFFPGLEVREALKIRIVRGNERLGILFFAHGHQGTLDSDRWAWISKPVVRHVWRPLQTRLNMRSTTPSRNFELRQRHDEAMYSWARNHEAKPVLIAGHTHRPVFWVSEPKPKESVADLEKQLESARASLTAEEGEVGKARAKLEVGKARAKLEFARAALREKGPPAIVIDPPCYFNTGCCSFGDGDVTGIEIANREIRLVRWPDDEAMPLPKTLVTASLADVLDRVAGAGRATGA